MKHQARMRLVLISLLVLGGCSGSKPTTYAIRGVVRDVNPAKHKVTISHEEIVGFMPKMTMPFATKQSSILDGIHPGDEVEGTLQVDFDAGEKVKEFYLTDLKVVGVGPRPPETSSEPTEIEPQALKLGDLVPDFSMTTQEGKPLKLADLRGKVVVLSFIYTRCPSPEFCPAMDAKFAELARRIGMVADRAAQVRLLSVSFDPEHDTPEVLRAHAARRGAKPPLWTFAVASHEELSQVAGPLGLTYIPGTREIDHNLRAAVIGPDGRLAAIEVGKDWLPSELVKTVQRLIPASEK